MTTTEIVENEAPARRSPGRPPKLTEESSRLALEAISLGATRQDAANRAGVSLSALERWLERGRAEKSTLYAKFASDVLRAENDAKLLAIGTVKAAMMGGQVLSEKIVKQKNGTTTTERTYSQADLRAATWYLERRYPQEWGRVDRIEFDMRSRIQQLADELGLTFEVVFAEAQRQAIAGATSGALQSGQRRQ